LSCFGVLASRPGFASDAKEPLSIRNYFEKSLTSLKVKECAASQPSTGPWPLKRVFVKVKPQVGIGINDVLSLTVAPEIGLGFERVTRKVSKIH
jgi:hypothetical protein